MCQSVQDGVDLASDRYPWDIINDMNSMGSTSNAIYLYNINRTQNMNEK